ncbi:MAG: cupin domain-containing protein [Chloroflexota bacterium]
MISFQIEQLVSHLDDYPWEYLEDPRFKEKDGEQQLRWKTLTGGEGAITQGISFGICEVPPGAELATHYHKDPEVYYVYAGQGEVLLGEDIVYVRPGSIVFVPGNLKHRLRNHSEETLGLLWMFAVDKWSEVEYHI